MATAVQYDPPGAVAERFLWARGYLTGLRGPVGSGKSSAACWKMVLCALEQEPFEGVRRTRWIVVRNTYPELKSTTIKTWQDWFPEDVAPMKWDTPITSKLFIEDIGDGTSLEMEVVFLAIDRPEDLGKLRSLEGTGAWINEASEIDKSILDMLTQRINRYPALRKGGPTWAGIIADTNPPDDEHWWYHFAEEETPKNWQFFSQPGALYQDQKTKEYLPNPEAENVRNIKGGYQYWLNQLAGKNEEWIRVFLLGEYGTTHAGKPVYPEYRDRYHVATEKLEPTRGLPILLAWDYGLTPACVAMQMAPTGQVKVLREWCAPQLGMGIRQFASDIVRPAVFNDYPRFRIESVGDPAGNQRAQTDERTCMQELSSLGFPTEMASTNEFVARREAVAFFLLRNIAGDPGFLLDPGCTMIRRGFNGRYLYQRIQQSGASRFKERPEKNEYSHPHDALQYGCLYMRSGSEQVKALPVSNARSARGWT